MLPTKLPPEVVRDGDTLFVPMESGWVKRGNLVLAAGLWTGSTAGFFLAPWLWWFWAVIATSGLVFVGDAVRPAALRLNSEELVYTAFWRPGSKRIRWDEVVSVDVGWYSASLTRKQGVPVNFVVFTLGQELRGWLQAELGRRVAGMDRYSRLGGTTTVEGVTLFVGRTWAEKVGATSVIGISGYFFSPVAVGVALGALSWTGMAFGLTLGAVLLGVTTWMLRSVWAPADTVQIGVDHVALFKGDRVVRRLRLADVTRCEAGTFHDCLYLHHTDGEPIRVFTPALSSRQQLLALLVDTIDAAAKRVGPADNPEPDPELLALMARLRSPEP